MTRTPLGLVPYVVAAGAIAAGLLWHAVPSAPVLGRAQTSGEAAIGGPFALVDQNGTLRHSSDFRGRFMLVYFGYSYCPDVCPTTLALMADALGRLGPKAERIVPIFITIDPARDRPAVLKEYLKAFGGRIVGLTGNGQAVAAAARAYRVYYRRRPLQGGGYAMDHSSTVYLMGPDGKFLANYDQTMDPGALAAALRAYL